MSSTTSITLLKVVNHQFILFWCVILVLLIFARSIYKLWLRLFKSQVHYEFITLIFPLFFLVNIFFHIFFNFFFAVWIVWIFNFISEITLMEQSVCRSKQPACYRSQINNQNYFFAILNIAVNKPLYQKEPLQ